jgi:SAM-dependent methyltransferase
VLQSPHQTLAIDAAISFEEAATRTVCNLVALQKQPMPKKMKTGDQYDEATVAQAFATFSAEIGGEKALLWRALRQRMINLDLSMGRGAKVLDFGCGTGWLVRQAALEFGVSAVGYDPASSMIDQTQTASGATYVADLTEAKRLGPYHQAFMVFVTPALSTAAALEDAFEEIVDNLVKGGRLSVACANPEAVFARHAFFQSEKPAGRLKAGVIHKTHILSATGDVIVTVDDTYWPLSTLVSAARRTGLMLETDCQLADGASGLSNTGLPYRILDFVSPSGPRKRQH